MEKINLRAIVGVAALVFLVGALALRDPHLGQKVFQTTNVWLTSPLNASGPEGNVYRFWGNGNLKAFDKTGKPIWTTSNGIYIASAPVVGKDGTVYVAEGAARLPNAFGSNSGLLALRPDGSIKWRFSVRQAAPVSGDGFPNDFFVRAMDFGEQFDASAHIRNPTIVSVLSQPHGLESGSKRLAPSTNNEMIFAGGDNSASPSLDNDGTIYFPGPPGNTMTALNADGSLRWRYSSTLQALYPPTLGSDGSLYFTGAFNTEASLVALRKNGVLKWQLPLGPHWSGYSPAVASDGTLFEVSSEPKVTAVNSEGAIKWIWRPPRRFSNRQVSNWRSFKLVLKDDFGNANVFTTPPWLTAEGWLCVGFGRPYESFYVLQTDTSLDSNSPWPNPSGQVTLPHRIMPWLEGR